MKKKKVNKLQRVAAGYLLFLFLKLLVLQTLTTMSYPKLFFFGGWGNVSLKSLFSLCLRDHS